MFKSIKAIISVFAILFALYSSALFANNLNVKTGLFLHEMEQENFKFNMPFKMGIFNLKKQIQLMTSFNNYIISVQTSSSNYISSKIAGYTEFSVPAGTPVVAIRGGKIESIKDGVITVVESSTNGPVRKWIYSNIESSSIPNRLHRILNSRYEISSGDKIGVVKSWDGVIQGFKEGEKFGNFGNFGIKIPSLDHLKLEVKIQDNRGVGNLFNPLPYFGLKDTIAPVIQRIFILRGKDNSIFREDNFFLKPVIRGEVKIAINAYDKMNLPRWKGDNIFTGSGPCFKLGIKKAYLRIKDVFSGRIIYKSAVNPAQFLTETNREKIAERFYLKKLKSEIGVLMAKSGKLNRSSFLVLTHDQKNKKMGVWNTLNYTNGPYKLIVTVSDNYGNKTVKTKEVLVNN